MSASSRVKAVDFNAFATGAGHDEAHDFVTLFHGFDGGSAITFLVVLMGIRPSDGLGGSESAGRMQIYRLNVGTAGEEGFHRVSAIAGRAALVEITAEVPAGFGFNGGEAGAGSFSLARVPIVRLSVMRWLASESGA